MSGSNGSFYPQWTASMQSMKTRVPEFGRSFGAMFQGLMKDGALSAREKELIALSISLALRCETCIWSHVDKCLKLGATPEQILDAAGVAVVMQGGPSYTYVPKVIEAIDALVPKAATPA